MRIIPVLVVEEVEPCLPFWVDRMGFQKLVEIPDGDDIGFVILMREGIELMLQSIESVRKDEPAFAPVGASRVASLHIEVDDFDDILMRLEGYPIAMSDRTTYYGMREVGVFEPGGNIVIFSTSL